MRKYIGLDVHSKKIVYVAMDEQGQVIGKGQIETSEAGLKKLLRQVRCRKGTQVGLESGQQAFLVARWLVGLGMEPKVIHAQEVRAKARRKRQKSDSRDAYEICDGLRRGIWEAFVYVPTQKVQRLRQLLSRRRHFVKVSTMQVNAAKFLLRSVGVKFAGQLASEQAWQKLLAQKELRPLREHLQMHAEMWRLARQHIDRLERQLEEATEDFKQQMEILTSMPGVGKITAAGFIAAVGDVRRFEHAGKLASYLGVVPSSYDSGERVRHGRITRSGPDWLRALLCEAAHHAGRLNHPLNPYWRRLMVRHGYRRAVIAIAHRMVRILYKMWLRGERFDVGKLNVVYEPGTLQRQYIYRLREAV